MSDGYKYSAFTKKYFGLQRRLITNVVLVSDNKHIAFRAAWDTGATSSGISFHAAKKLNLQSVDTMVMHTPSGAAVRHVYIVDLHVCDGMRFDNVRVTEASIHEQGFDVLIGMDIILKGDFCISNYRGMTTLAFRVPSQGVTDFITVSEGDVLVKNPWWKFWK